MLRHTLLSALLVLTSVATAAHVDGNSVVVGDRYLVIVDLSTGDTDNTPSLDQRWYVFPASTADTALTAVHTLDSGGTISAVKATLKPLAASSDPRTFLNAGDTFRVVVVYSATQLIPSVKISEERRKSRIVEDLGTLVKLATAIAGKGLEREKPVFKLLEMTGGTNGVDKRSTIKISVKTKAIPKPKPGTAQADPIPDAFDADSMTPDVSVDVVLINGPPEHLFISADVPVTKVSQVKYDNTGHAIGTKATPTTAYAGLNLMAGDVLAATRDRWFDGFMLKGMAKLAKRPADSYGGGIGYRFPDAWKAFGYDLNNLSVFVAYLRTRTVTNGTKTFSNDVRGGISFNLDKALDWFKSK
jgi:hypothetical protein